MTYRTTFRDRIAWRVSNWLLNHVATKEYRAFVTVLIAKGRKQLDKELGIGNNP